MLKRILIIGGYGNFGRRITELLAMVPQCQLIIGGRDITKASALARWIPAVNPPETVQLDIRQDLEDALFRIAPDIVIHTSGPFQGQDYAVAKACIKQGSHYIDLADARDFVSNIGVLDHEARKKDVLICSGASSVPTLSSAVIENHLPDFNSLESVRYGISTAQRTGSGLATTSAVLSYAGKPFKTLVDGRPVNVYGWQDFSLRKFWKLNHRLLGNCDIPDLDLFPRFYPSLKTLHFQAGLELKLIHSTLFILSWAVRLSLIPSLQPSAPLLLKLAGLLNIFGSNDSGFFMEMRDANNKKRILFELVAHSGDGLYIPCIPAVVLAKKIVLGKIVKTGAFPCIGLVQLDEYLDALKEFDIEWHTEMQAD